MEVGKKSGSVQLSRASVIDGPVQTRAVGKSTRVEQLPRSPHSDGARASDGALATPVQAHGDAPAAAEPEAIRAAAAHGIAAPPGALPHGHTIQRLFGRHDISGVKAHVGGQAQAAARAMHADAYATGDHVAFATSPSLHTAAHEAAHVVQQRGGVQLKGGVGQVGDTYEKHADEVADLVVQGKSAEAVLDRHAGSGSAQAGEHVQRFYVETPQDPGYAWIDNAEWNAERYELSPQQPSGWLFYHLYRPKADPVQDRRQQQVRQQQWQRRVEQLRSTLANQERDPKKFDAAAARKQVDAALDTALSGITGDERQARLEELRVYIDRFPAYFSDHVVNVAHAAIAQHNNSAPQVGIAGVSYLAPSKTPDDKHVMTRGISEVVLIDGMWYAPVYMTVFGDALGETTPRFKDAGQDAKGRVEIHSGKGAGSDNTQWLSIGRPLRQLKWMEKYESQGAAEPLIRSFLIPLSIADAISGGAITEHESAGSGKDLNVDKHYERNQFGVVDPASMEKLRQYALPGSLRTYTDQSLVARPKSWGEVRPADELRTRVGVPPRRIPGFDVFVDRTAQEFTSKSKYQEQVDTLTRLHAYYSGNALFLPAGESMPGKAERDARVHDFFVKHMPSDLQDDAAGLATFMTEYVAPWATQAQIAEQISEDFDDISDPDKERGDLPTSAVGVNFSGQDMPPGRGQRRSDMLALSSETQQLLAARQVFLAAIKAAMATIKEILPIKPANPTRNRMLNQMRSEFDTITGNYDFFVGRVEAVQRDLPAYKASVAAWHVQLTASPDPEPKVAELAEQLRIAAQ